MPIVLIRLRNITASVAYIIVRNIIRSIIFARLPNFIANESTAVPALSLDAAICSFAATPVSPTCSNEVAVV